MKAKHSSLGEIADVRIGLTLRGQDASKQTDEGGLHLLRIGDITESGSIQIDNPHPIKVTKSMERFRVLPGDLVLANRGTRMTAALVGDEIEAVAGGQIYIVRTERNKMLPEFLWWFLNRTSTQQFLKLRAMGSYVKTVPVQVLREELEVPVPPLEVQKLVVELAMLTQREQELISQIAELKRSYIDSVLGDLVNQKISE